MFLINTRKRSPDGAFGHERTARGAYAVYEFTQKSGGKEVEEKTLQDVPTDKDALVLVHGFNNDFIRVTGAYLEFEKAAQKAGFAGSVVGFTWPSYGKWFQYFGDRAQVEYAAFGFLNFLLDYRPLLGARKCHLNAHSMGAYLVIRALAAYALIDAIPESAPGGALLGEITLFAADVDGNTLEKDQEGSHAAAEAARLTSYFSGHDQVLAIADVANAGPRLGLEGAAHPARMPKNACQIDCTTLVFDHAGYRADPGVMQDLAAVLGGAPSDQIAGRRKENAKNTFAIGPEEDEEEEDGPGD